MVVIACVVVVKIVVSVMLVTSLTFSQEIRSKEKDRVSASKDIIFFITISLIFNDVPIIPQKSLFFKFSLFAARFLYFFVKLLKRNPLYDRIIE